MKLSTSLAFLGLGLLPLCAHADPVGMAANVKGTVTVTEAGKSRPLHLLNRLEPGSTVSCGPGASAVIVLFKDGARYEIGAGQSVKVNPTGVAGGQRMAAMSGPSSEAVRLLGKARVGAVSARDPASYARLTPSALPYLVGLTPQFNWQSEPEAARYTFTLFDSEDNILWSTTTTTASATYPQAGIPLAEKQSYIWKLSCFASSGKVLPSKGRWGVITLLSPQDASELSAVVTKLREEAKTAPDSTPLLLLAAAYRDYGVLNGALEILDEYPLSQEPGVGDALNDIKDAMSPFARVLARRDVTFQPEP